MPVKQLIVSKVKGLKTGILLKNGILHVYFPRIFDRVLLIPYEF